MSERNEAQERFIQQWMRTHARDVIVPPTESEISQEEPRISRRGVIFRSGATGVISGVIFSVLTYGVSSDMVNYHEVFRNTVEGNIGKAILGAALSTATAMGTYFSYESHKPS